MTSGEICSHRAHVWSAALPHVEEGYPYLEANSCSALSAQTLGRRSDIGLHLAAFKWVDLGSNGPRQLALASVLRRAPAAEGFTPPIEDSGEAFRVGKGNVARTERNRVVREFIPIYQEGRHYFEPDLGSDLG